MTLHILVGQEAFYEEVQSAARGGDGAEWIVPKKCVVGDEVLLFFRHRNAFVGCGTVLTAPTAAQFGRRACYSSNVGRFRVFSRPVSLDAVLEKFPDWPWATYPRSYTSQYPDGLLEFLESASSRIGQ